MIQRAVHVLTQVQEENVAQDDVVSDGMVEFCVGLVQNGGGELQDWQGNGLDAVRWWVILLVAWQLLLQVEIKIDSIGG